MTCVFDVIFWLFHPGFLPCSCVGDMKKELELARPKVPDLKNPKMKKSDIQDVEMKDREKSDEDKEEKKDADLLTLEGTTSRHADSTAVPPVVAFCCAK